MGAPLLAGFARSGAFAVRSKFRIWEKGAPPSVGITDKPTLPSYFGGMPWGLKRYHETGALHFITWSCHGRQPLLGSPERRDLLPKVLEQMRNRHRFVVVGFVVMPEHVHLLISEPLIGSVSSAISAVKLGFTRRILSKDPTGADFGQHFWMKRYYDFNVFSEPKIAEELHYMHQNPVARGLVERPEQWNWSSFRAYASGDSGIVQVNDWSWWEKKIQSRVS